MKKQTLKFEVTMPDDACPLDLMRDMLEAYREKPRRIRFKVTAMDWYPTDDPPKPSED